MIQTKNTLVYSYTFVTFWWALGQFKCTSKISFVVEDDSESSIKVCALLELTKNMGNLYYVPLLWYMISDAGFLYLLLYI